jgi:L-fuculose-phosphate aldolase
MWLATELETLAQQYVNVLQIGGGVVLSDAQVDEALDAFAGYGLQDQPPQAGK